MENITPLIREGKQVIDGYGGGGFRIARTRYESSVIVFPDSAHAWEIKTFEDIGETSFELVLAQAEEVDVLLIGCGKKQYFLPPAIEQQLRARRIVPEVMDTGAACRTYNVLLSEGRRVAAALIAV